MAVDTHRRSKFFQKPFMCKLRGFKAAHLLPYLLRACLQVSTQPNRALRGKWGATQAPQPWKWGNKYWEILQWVPREPTPKQHHRSVLPHLPVKLIVSEEPLSLPWGWDSHSSEGEGSALTPKIPLAKCYSACLHQVSVVGCWLQSGPCEERLGCPVPDTACSSRLQLIHHRAGWVSQLRWWRLWESVFV